MLDCAYDEVDSPRPRWVGMQQIVVLSAADAQQLVAVPPLPCLLLPRAVLAWLAGRFAFA